MNLILPSPWFKFIFGKQSQGLEQTLPSPETEEPELV